MRKCEISKEWASFILYNNVQPGKNSFIYEIHKLVVSVRLLTKGCNITTENLATFVEKICTALTENITTKLNGSYYLSNVFENLNAKGKPNNAILISFDIVSMFSSARIDNRGIAAVKNIQNSRSNLPPSMHQCSA